MRAKVGKSKQRDDIALQLSQTTEDFDDDIFHDHKRK
jgi:hypothetical protein